MHIQDLYTKKNVMAVLMERNLVLEKVEVEETEVHLEEISRLERLKQMLEEKEAFHQEAIDTERDYRIAKLRKEVDRNRHSCSRGLGHCSPCIRNEFRDLDIVLLEAALDQQRSK
jgi:hypothetical protein